MDYELSNMSIFIYIILLSAAHSKYCKTCVQYKVPSDANMESMLMNNVDSADYACIYRPGLCHRKKCRDENDVCAAIHVILGKEENGELLLVRDAVKLQQLVHRN